MKKTTYFFSLFIFLWVFQASGYAQEKVVISSGDWPPYTAAKLKNYGYALHIISSAFETQGVQVEYSFLPWKRAYVKAEKGEFAATAVWFRNKEREAVFHFSDSIESFNTVLFHRKDKQIEWKTMADLKKYTIGITHGYTYGDEFNKAAKEYGYKLDKSPTDISGFKKLIKERIDVFLCDFGVGYWMLHNDFPSAVKSLVTNSPNVLMKNTVHVLATKKKPESLEILKKLNKGLGELKQKGMMEQFKDKLIEGYYGN